MSGRRRTRDLGVAMSAAGIWSLVARSTIGCEGERKEGKGVVE